MLAARLEERGSLQVRDVPEPAERSGYVTVRVGACGVCGTDRHILHGTYQSALPVTLGHEFAGVVTAAPRGAGIAVGTTAAIDPNIACGTCRACRKGDICLCPNRLALGVDLDGGLAEYVAVPETQLYALPRGLPIEFGAMCEPLACCIRALDRACLVPGMSVAIVGGGVIGLLMVQLARLAGAGHVTLVTRQASRRVLACRTGADDAINPGVDEVVNTIAGPGGVVPGGVDVTFECVGSAATFEQCIALTGRGGTILVFGVAPVLESAAVRPFELFERELRIVGSYLNPFTHGRAVELVASGRLTLEPLITHRAPLADVPTILGEAPRAGEVKVMVLP